MMFENLGLGFAWGWINGSGGEGPSKAVRKKPMRRVDNKHDAEGPLSGSSDGRYYPGLVNISGTYCFMNSTLQAMASLTYLQPHIEAIHARAEQFDVPTPVVDAFRDILIELNSPTSKPRSLRPHALINALSSPTGSSKSRSALFSSREHQDAQELFQLLSETIKNEAKAVEEEASRDRGLGALSRESSPNYLVGRGSVFDGLTANRRSCVECGYTEAVMHFAFDNWQLAVPRMANCHLEDCLADYTRLELLSDCICRKCSMLATHKRLLAEAEKATDAVTAGEGSTSSSKKKRAREARRLEAKVKAALHEGRIEEDIKGVKMEKIFSRCSTKQAMIARPPPVLALHLNRSIHYGHSGVKNTCRVLFPELLDLTPYTTSGQLSISPSAPISSPPATLRPSTPTQSDQNSRSTTPRTLYRLSAVVCHYGTHSFGHYVAYRRKPRPPQTGIHRYDPPTLYCPLDCDCEKCAVFGPIRDEETAEKDGTIKTEMPAYAASRWLRISDESVEEVGIERVLGEYAGTFMLYYEKVLQVDLETRQFGAEEEVNTWLASASIINSNTPIALWSSTSPRSSEETIKPAKESRSPEPQPDKESESRPERSSRARSPRSLEARIVHSVYAGRSRTPTPSLRGFAVSYSL
ncbi:hypothetical protein BU17DRAFT_75586 [Hysterangium stoloniferum]|nr:hypothetical protein BU17DRAFT_75586 [Hysterangium stoloniferum]